MNFRVSVAVLFSGVVMAAAVPAARGDVFREVEWRQQFQMQRIRQGVESGALTPREAEKLLERQREIRQMAHAAGNGGVITPRKRKALTRALNEETRKIYMAKQGRYYALGSGTDASPHRYHPLARLAGLPDVGLRPGIADRNKTRGTVTAGNVILISGLQLFPAQ